MKSILRISALVLLFWAFLIALVADSASFATLLLTKAAAALLLCIIILLYNRWRTSDPLVRSIEQWTLKEE